MNGACALLSLLLADPSWRELEGRASTVAILAALDEADAEERQEMLRRLRDAEESRRFMEARPVLVPFDGALRTVEELLGTLPPALAPAPSEEEDPGVLWTEPHERARAALEAIRAAYADPRPVGPGTVGLFLSIIARVLDAPGVDLRVRLRLLFEALSLLRSVEGRAAPDAYGRFLLREEIVPAVAGLAREWRGDRQFGHLTADAAAQLYLPAFLDDDALESLSSSAGSASRESARLKSLRRGALSPDERVAFARSVCAQAADDPAFCASSAPILLELLADPTLPRGERAAIVAVALDRMANFPPLLPAALDLLSVAFGEAPRSVEAYAADRDKVPDAAPREGKVRLLQLLLLKSRDRPPYVVRALREDVAPLAPVYALDRLGDRRFVGVVAPGARGYDLVGPAPGFLSQQDARLLRRPLDRVTVAVFGTEREELELTVALRDGEEEPVSIASPTVASLVAFVRARLAAAADGEERRGLVRFLVRIDLHEARDLAVESARDPATVAELLPLLERGHLPAARALLAALGALEADARARVLAAISGTGDESLRDLVRGRCREGAPALAASCAQALLATGDTSGVKALLARKEPALRALAAGLALRTTTLAGGMRVTPEPPIATMEVAGAFRREDGAIWVDYAAFLRRAFDKPEEVLRERRNHCSLYHGDQRVTEAAFADSYRKDVERKRIDAPMIGKLVWFVLHPEDPGRGIPREALDRLLDALEKRALADDRIRERWIQSLLLLACVQYGMEQGEAFFGLALDRLARIPGAPPRDAGLPAFVEWAAG